MPLVTPLSAAHDLETKELAEFFNETLGFCPNSVLTMQRRPAISKAFINLNKAVMANEGRVTSALKRMIAWVSSNATGCRYCQAHAIRAAERYGAAQEQLDNIWEYKTHAAFSEAERAALDFSLAASMVPNAVDAKIKETFLLGVGNRIYSTTASKQNSVIYNNSTFSFFMGIEKKSLSVTFNYDISNNILFPSSELTLGYKFIETPSRKGSSSLKNIKTRLRIFGKKGHWWDPFFNNKLNKKIK